MKPPSWAPRWLHKFYADSNGYFWLPCPRCGREFGGHEWRGSIAIDRTRGLVTCCPGVTTLDDQAFYSKEFLLRCI